MPGIASPLANRRPGDIDFVVVARDTRASIVRWAGRCTKARQREIVIQETVMSRTAIDRSEKFAFRARAVAPEEAPDRPRPRATASRSRCRTGTIASRRMRRRLYRRAHRTSPHRHPDRALRAAPGLVRRRRRLQPVRRHPVRSRPACTGTIASRVSNLNPDRTFPVVVRAVHGSAPDIAGKGIANPIGRSGARR